MPCGRCTACRRTAIFYFFIYFFGVGGGGVSSESGKCKLGFVFLRPSPASITGKELKGQKWVGKEEREEESGE